MTIKQIKSMTKFFFTEGISYKSPMKFKDWLYCPIAYFKFMCLMWRECNQKAEIKAAND